ncbi:MAG: TVP38/TMEM64 family protein [Phycisphaerales bacterium]|nr:TVP38/TMEM64 family protein [Phycisphaerales bacterium]
MIDQTKQLIDRFHHLAPWRRKAVFVLGALWLTVPPLMGFWLIAQLGPVGDWLRERPEEGLTIFIAVFAITSGFGVLPTYAQAILGGWVFGATTGSAAAMCGLTAGAAIGLFLARFISGGAIIALVDSNPRGAVIRKALVEASQGRTFFLIALLRLPPNSPFAIANLAMGAAGVRPLPMLAGTAIGMLPRTIVTCAFAATAAATGAHDIQELVVDKGWIGLTIGIATLIVVMMIIAAIARKALKRAGLMVEAK